MTIKKMKKNLFFIFLFLLVSFIVWEKFSKKFPINIPISFSKQEFPVIKGCIEGKEYPFKLSLNSKYPFFIDAQTLDKIPKKQKGEAVWQNIAGETKTSALFEIANIQISNLKLKNTMVVPDYAEFKDQESLGRFAWPLDKMDLVLDFPHYQIIGINNKKELIRLGYDLSKMEKAKCTINKKGIYFKAITDIGELNVMLTTSFNLNAINNLIWNDGQYLMSKLKIGNRNFEEIKLHPFGITQELEVDAVLGAEFLKNHILYIDVKNETLYFGDNYANVIEKRSIAKIPLEFTFSGLPVAEIEIQKKKYPVLIDMGSCCELLLPPFYYHCLKDLRYINKSYSINVLGEERVADCFVLNEYKIGNSLLKNIFVIKEKEKGINLGVYKEKMGTVDSKQVGSLGYPLLYRTNIYFDFANSGLWFIENAKDLRKINIQLEDFEKVPFELQNGMIIVNVKSDKGQMRLFIDTGATASTIKPEFYNDISPTMDSDGNPRLSSSTFVIGNSDYGETRLFSFNISSKLGNIDGILGMEFLRQHPFYIDYPNRLIYFKKPKGNQVL